MNISRLTTFGGYFESSTEKATFRPQRLPNCLIIGSRKSGTRALLDFLSLHPKIAVAKQEAHFFDDDRFYSLGFSWYAQRMPEIRYDDPAPLIIIEKTPAYFVNDKAPGRIFAFNSSIKLILILRDPVTRLISDYTQILHTKASKGKMTFDLEHCVDFYLRNQQKLHSKESHHYRLWNVSGMTLAIKKLDRFQSSSNSSLNSNLNAEYRMCHKPFRNSLYAKHLLRWLNKFSLERNLHIVDGDVFIKNPFAELQNIETFLELDHLIDRRSLYFNETKGFYCFNHTKYGPRCMGDSKGRRHVRVRNETIAKLRTFFEKSNRQLFHLINKTFDW